MTDDAIAPILPILRRFPLRIVPGGQVTSAFGGFSGARVWHVETHIGPVAVRCWPTDAIPPARLMGLHRLLEHIHRSGVRQVSVPIRALDGQTFVVERGRKWHIEPWMPGTADFHSNPSPARLAAAMSCLARWHAAAATFEPKRDESEWFRQSPAEPSPAVQQRAKSLEEWLSIKLRRAFESTAVAPASPFREVAMRVINAATAVAPRVQHRLDAVRRTPFRLEPVLRDVWHDHVLFTRNEITGLIDAAACRTESVAADLSRLLGSLLGDDPARWSEAVTVYPWEGSLSDAEFDLCRTLDQSGVLLSALRWLERRYLENDLSVETEAVLHRLTGFAGRLELLANHFW